MNVGLRVTCAGGTMLLLALTALPACTGILGDFDVAAMDGGASIDGSASPPPDGGASDGDAGGRDAGVDASLPDGGTCTAPRQSCGTACVDTRSDPQNCGACGTRCATCNDGACGPFAALWLGTDVTFARGVDGVTKSWGNNALGVLEQGASDANAHPKPAPIAGDPGFVSFGLGPDFGCGVVKDGTAACWGSDTYGQLGTGLPLASSVKPAPLALTDVAEIAAGDSFACARTKSEGRVQCWGINDAQQLGFSTTTTCIDALKRPIPCSATPGAVTTGVTAISGVAHLVAGRDFACALFKNGHVSCWGSGRDGALGNGAEKDMGIPVDVKGINDAIDLAAYAYGACAVHANGTVSCWGRGSMGELGFTPSDACEGANAIPCALTPGLVVDGKVPLSGAVQVAVGSAAACARLGDGTLRCWGDQEYGLLGNGMAGQGQVNPQRVALDGKATDIRMTNHACARLEDGTAECWGINDHGQLGSTTVDVCTGFKLPCSTTPRAVQY